MSAPDNAPCVRAVRDVNGDGRDEVVLGSVCLDDDGVPLWAIGRGHPDGLHVGDVLPSRPGLALHDIPHDWEGFDSLQFWAYSAKATGDVWEIGVETNQS